MSARESQRGSAAAQSVESASFDQERGTSELDEQQPPSMSTAQPNGGNTETMSTIIGGGLWYLAAARAYRLTLTSAGRAYQSILASSTTIHAVPVWLVVGFTLTMIGISGFASDLQTIEAVLINATEYTAAAFPNNTMVDVPIYEWQTRLISDIHQQFPVEPFEAVLICVQLAMLLHGSWYKVAMFAGFVPLDTATWGHRHRVGRAGCCTWRYLLTSLGWLLLLFNLILLFLSGYFALFVHAVMGMCEIPHNGHSSFALFATVWGLDISNINDADRQAAIDSVANACTHSAVFSITGRHLMMLVAFMCVGMAVTLSSYVAVWSQHAMFVRANLLTADADEDAIEVTIHSLPSDFGGLPKVTVQSAPAALTPPDTPTSSEGTDPVAVMQQRTSSEGT